MGLKLKIRHGAIVDDVVMMCMRSLTTIGVEVKEP